MELQILCVMQSRTAIENMFVVLSLQVTSLLNVKESKSISTWRSQLHCPLSYDGSAYDMPHDLIGTFQNLVHSAVPQIALDLVILQIEKCKDSKKLQRENSRISPSSSRSRQAAAETRCRFRSLLHHPVHWNLFYVRDHSTNRSRWRSS